MQPDIKLARVCACHILVGKILHSTAPLQLRLFVRKLFGGVEELVSTLTIPKKIGSPLLFGQLQSMF